MPNLSIKDVPETSADALRQRAVEPDATASANPPSSNGAQASFAGSQSSAQRRSTVVGFDRFGIPIRRQGWKTVGQVVAELKAKYPDGPPPGQSSSIDMLREDRDSR